MNIECHITYIDMHTCNASDASWLEQCGILSGGELNTEHSQWQHGDSKSGNTSPSLASLLYLHKSMEEREGGLGTEAISHICASPAYMRMLQGILIFILTTCQGMITCIFLVKWLSQTICTGTVVPSFHQGRGSCAPLKYSWSRYELCP